MNAFPDTLFDNPPGLIELLEQRALLKRLLERPDFDEISTQTEPVGVSIGNAETPIESSSGSTIEAVLPKTVYDHPALADNTGLELSPDKAAVQDSNSHIIDSFSSIIEDMITAQSLTEKRSSLQEVLASARFEIHLFDDNRIREMTDAVGKILDSSDKNIADKNADLTIGIEQLRKQREALSESVSKSRSSETIERSSFFWEEFVPLIIKKLKLNPPVDEISAILDGAKELYTDFVWMTPPDESEIQKCLSEKWPAAVKSIHADINDLLEHTIQIWELKAGEQLSKLEEFRNDNLPGQPSIRDEISLNLDTFPALSASLPVELKKTGLMKLFQSATGKEKWRSESAEKIIEATEIAFAAYREAVLTWLASKKHVVDDYITLLQKKGLQSLDVIRGKVEVELDNIENSKVKLNAAFEEAALALTHSEKILREIDDFRSALQTWESVTLSDLE